MFISTQGKNQGHFIPIEVKSFEDFTKIILSKSYSLGTFKNNSRKKKNFIKASAIGLDFDCDYTLEQAKKDFKDFKCIIATTKSHQKEKNGLVQDRFRVILFLTEPITNNEIFYATWNKLATRWTKIDPQCKDSSRYWYPSKKIVMINKKGRLIKPATESVTTEATPDVKEYLKIGKGKLSKDTRRWLHRGIEAGQRNSTVFKIAKDFQENNFSEEEAIKYIIRALDANGTLTFDFTDTEAEAAIRSAYSSEPTNAPRQPFKLQPISSIYKMNVKTEWVVDRLMSKGGVSLWSAAPKVGKSWLARQLITDMLHKRDFLGRKTMFGEVHYYAIEEQPEVIKASFKKLGLKEDVPLYVHVGDVFSDNTMKEFHNVLKERKPTLVVVDTLFDLLQVESENNYKEVKRELARLRYIARDVGCHILCIHHSNKAGANSYSGPSGSGRTILGSQAIMGGVDAVVILELHGQKRVITAMGRLVKPITLRELVWNKESWTYSLGEKIETDGGF